MSQDWVEKLIQYVENFGMDVVNHEGLGLTTDWDIGRLDPPSLNDLIRKSMSLKLTRFL